MPVGSIEGGEELLRFAHRLQHARDHTRLRLIQQKLKIVGYPRRNFLTRRYGIIEDEIALVESYIAKKFRGKDLPVYLAEEKNLASAFRKLRLAGFSPGNAIRALKKYSRSAEELEDTDTDG